MEAVMELRAAFRNVEQFYRRFYWSVPEATTINGDGYTMSYSGVSWMHSINTLWVHQIEALDVGLLRMAARFFEQVDAEYSIVFSEAERSSVHTFLADQGFLERSGTPLYTLVGLPRPQHMNREIEVAVACLDQLPDLLDVLHSTFFMAPEAGRAMIRPDQFTDPNVRHYLGIYEGVVVGCATILLHEGIAGVWNVGTLRTFRKQGIASAILMHALVQASAEGYPASVLMASPMGKPLYEEMGYQFAASTYFYGPLT